MATQQFGYGPNVWGSAKGIGAIDIPKLQQPGAVAPDFKPENPYKALAAKAIGDMLFEQFMGGEKEEEEKSVFHSSVEDELYGQKYAEQRKLMEGKNIGANRQQHEIFQKSLLDNPDPLNPDDYRKLSFGNSVDSRILHYKHGVVSDDGLSVTFAPDQLAHLGVTANVGKELVIHKIGNDWYIQK